MGKNSMGTLLELGPERNVGRFYMGILFAVYSFAPVWKIIPTYTLLDTNCVLSFPSDVLVWSKLFAVSTAECAFV